MGMPAFLWRDKQLANMAAFKQHAGFGFWHRELAGDNRTEKDAMGQYGKITKLADLPPNDELVARAREGMALIEAGAKVPRTQQPKLPLAMPGDFAEALEAVPNARASFDRFPPGAQRDYLEWILEAKQPATRTRRIAQACEWIAEGKRRNWQYQR